MSEPLLTVRDLVVSFRTATGVVRAVDGVSFDVQPGEILGIVGESGSGKSLTVLAVLGLINDPNASVEGQIIFKGRDLTHLPEREMQRIRGREIAMIFQDPMTAMTPVYTIGAQIAEQVRLHKQSSRAAARSRAVELLEAVGIGDASHAVDRYPHEFSGGMRQRAMIAMALSCNPALLLADEPTTALDVTVQAEILDLIRKLRADFGSSVVLITHNLGVVAEVADRVRVMYSGRIAEAADTAELFADPWHPYTWGLLGSIPELDQPRRARLPAIPGLPPALDARPKGCAFAPRCRFSRGECAILPPLAGTGRHKVSCVLRGEERAADRAKVLAA
jgi:peptide/nickel transport system ATP-binding protein